MASGLFNLKQVNQAISQGAWSGYIAPRWVEYLVVAGGGGASTSVTSGGGGAGGLLTGIVTVSAGASYTVTVGAGGATATTTGNTGVNSVFGSISALGGGGGSQAISGATSGGSGGGGGGGINDISGAGTFGQGNAGGGGTTAAAPPYPARGGGGAGTVGLNAVVGVAGNGGAGIASSISGTVTAYAGGGGGGVYGSGTNGVGGVGGGGTGGVTTGTAGSANTGGGGGGAGLNAGAAGGSGIVVVRYPGNVVFFTGGTVNYNNGYIIHIFTSNGTLAPTAPAPYNTSYQISRSLRFNSADSAYLNRTPASAGNRRTWTFSAWVKRSALSGSDYPQLMSADGGTYGSKIGYFADNTFWVDVGQGATFTRLNSTAVYRDVSAWYHVVVAQDTTQATDTNRVKVYINGSQIALSGTYPTQNFDGSINNTTAQNIGRETSAVYYFNGYMTEINLIDGQALTPSSFGATSTTTGVWSPIQYTGTYGTNGFYLNFSDNSNTTAATLGADYSGNGNNWTPNNFSVTAGAGNDSMVDSPTQYGFDTGVGGTVRGNYCTLNPLAVDPAYVPTITNGNLDISSNGVLATMSMPTGTWYWEVTCTSTDADQAVGAYSTSETGKTSISGNANPTYGFIYQANGNARQNGTVVQTWSTFTNNDIISFTYDASIYQLKAYKNNSLVGTITLTTPPSGDSYVPMAVCLGGSFTFNFGQRPFAYTAPSGFKALCTQNLPTPTIGATSNSLATQFFNPVLYSGNSATQSITGVGFQPDWVWIKARNVSANHALFDSVRGTGKVIQSNTTAAEATDNTTLTAFNSDGFSLGAAAGSYIVNTSTYTFVAWNWRAGNNAGASNSAGSITSTVSVNTTSGFSVVTYTGTGSAATIGHGLGVAPSMVMTKSRSNNTGDGFTVYHKSLPSAAYWLELANATAQSGPNSVVWNSTAPTSSVFSVGSSSGTNQSTYTYVAYCFAEVAGYSKFGSYTGNGSSSGPFVFTNMQVAYVMIKCTDTAVTDWAIFDNKRNTFNVVNTSLEANLSLADYTSTSLLGIDFLSNGFRLIGTDNGVNGSAKNYIFMAFAQNPFKYSLAR